MEWKRNEVQLVKPLLITGFYQLVISKYCFDFYQAKLY